MPGIGRSYLQTFQLRGTGVRGCGIVNKGIEGRLFRVLKEIAAEQLAIGGQDSYGPFGMPRQTDDPGLKTVLREVVSIIKENVGCESLGCPKTREDREEGSDEMLGFVLFTNMSPRPAMPESSRCMPTLAPRAERRWATFPIWSKSPCVSRTMLREAGLHPALSSSLCS